MQQLSIVPTPHKLLTANKMSWPLGGSSVVIRGSDLSVRSLLHALLLILRRT